jgi:copper chaperone NosL
MKRLLRIGLLLSASALLWGCGRDRLSGPPSVALGRDQCAACGMLINEDRCSSAVLIERGGRDEYAHFDDIGCMLDYEHEQGSGLMVRERYLHDYSDRAWITHAQAVFIFTDPDKLPTPMGSGIVAFRDQDRARKALEVHGGELMDYARLVPARRAWMETRYGKPRGGN